MSTPRIKVICEDGTSNSIRIVDQMTGKDIPLAFSALEIEANPKCLIRARLTIEHVALEIGNVEIGPADLFEDEDILTAAEEIQRGPDTYMCDECGGFGGHAETCPKQGGGD